MKSINLLILVLCFGAIGARANPQGTLRPWQKTTRSGTYKPWQHTTGSGTYKPWQHTTGSGTYRPWAQTTRAAPSGLRVLKSIDRKLSSVTNVLMVLIHQIQELRESGGSIHTTRRPSWYYSTKYPYWHRTTNQYNVQTTYRPWVWHHTTNSPNWSTWSYTGRFRSTWLPFYFRTTAKPWSYGFVQSKDLGNTK